VISQACPAKISIQAKQVGLIFEARGQIHVSFIAIDRHVADSTRYTSVFEREEVPACIESSILPWLVFVA
jgi:hypothetical protein